MMIRIAFPYLHNRLFLMPHTPLMDAGEWLGSDFSYDHRWRQLRWGDLALLTDWKLDGWASLVIFTQREKFLQNTETLLLNLFSRLFLVQQLKVNTKITFTSSASRWVFLRPWHMSVVVFDLMIGSLSSPLRSLKGNAFLIKWQCL